MIESDDYKRGWYDGYQAAKREQSVNIPTTPFIPPLQSSNACKTCGMIFNGAMGYVCYHPNCPSKVTVTCGGEPYV